MIAIEDIISKKYRINIIKNSINFYSNKNFYLILNSELKKILEKSNNYKVIFTRKILIGKNNKFLSIRIKKEKLPETSILKLINSIKYDDLFKLRDISKNKVFLIIVKKDFFEDNYYKNIIKGFKKYKIDIEEVSYIKPYSNILLEIIDENIFKYKTFLIHYEEGTEDFIYKNLKDSGEKKLNLNEDFFVFKRKNSKIVAFNEKRFYKIVKEIIKEEIWKSLE